MTPTVQGLLGPDKRHVVLVREMIDDFYSLSSLLPANAYTEAPEKAVILVSSSCQDLITQAIHKGSQTQAADQVDRIYILQPATMETMANITARQ